MGTTRVVNIECRKADEEINKKIEGLEGMWRIPRDHISIKALILLDLVVSDGD